VTVPASTTRLPVDSQQQHGGCDDEQKRAPAVDPVPGAGDGEFLQRFVDDAYRYEPERQVDPEDQRPVQVFGKGAAEQGAGDAGNRPCAGNPGGIAGAFERRHEISDHGLRQREQAAAAKSLHGTACYKNQHVGREGADDGAGQKNQDRCKNDRTATVNIGNLAVQRGDRGRGEQICRHHPGQIFGMTERGGHGWQGRRDNGLVESGQQHGKKHTCYDDVLFAIGEREAGHGPFRLAANRLVHYCFFSDFETVGAPGARQLCFPALSCRSIR
jgi:hypothetical protein